ncbi:outer mitochondrial transmembrane helix translocase isoform X1 [Vidua chalybeata]|uniref:outer mitochondrial transmembrane helix translocase isoform X1 n=1 Tax=Vidua chalybeata TaxID=81927 RepID=UPI0023A8DF94|nr:outer mitochondrial transmembrane helix translocase isoform X1 [Vidua chalybeata]
MRFMCSWGCSSRESRGPGVPLEPLRSDPGRSRPIPAGAAPHPLGGTFARAAAGRNLWAGQRAPHGRRKGRTRAAAAGPSAPLPAFAPLLPPALPPRLLPPPPPPAARPAPCPGVPESRRTAEKLMKQIGVKNVKLTEYEMSIAAHLVDPLSMHVTWSDIAGLDDVITDLKDTVILPIKKKYLFENSRLLQPPKGVLLYGPPGCGKTLIAKATAKEAGCRFINLQPSTLTDKWYGESQKLAAAVFSLAIKLQPSIIFIDEIDSFLRNRSSTDHEATAMMKAQFMSLWDGLDTDYNCQVIVMGATNRPQDLDSAIMRRMPTRFHINQPALKQREAILKLILKNENVDSHVDLLQVAKETDGFSGSDLKEMCRDAALLCVREYVNNACEEDVHDEDEIRPVQQQDLHRAIEKMRKSKDVSMQNLAMEIVFD